MQISRFRGGSPKAIVTVKMYGTLCQGFSPIASILINILSNLYRWARRRPYISRFISQYAFKGDLGQPAESLAKYSSSDGSLEWMDACLALPDFKGRFLRTRSAARKISWIINMPGTNQSVFVQSTGSRFTIATILYLARLGFPNSPFWIAEIAIEGSTRLHLCRCF